MTTDKKLINMKELKLRKGQKCHACKKLIRGIWCYNGFYFHSKCKEKDTKLKIKNYLKVGIK